jgi:hypothetical protein
MASFAHEAVSNTTIQYMKNDNGDVVSYLDGILVDREAVIKFIQNNSIAGMVEFDVIIGSDLKMEEFLELVSLFRNNGALKINIVFTSSGSQFQINLYTRQKVEITPVVTENIEPTRDSEIKDFKIKPDSANENR